MTVKERLYQFINEKPHNKQEHWMSFQKTCPQVRFKTVGSARAILIQLDGHSDWMNPDVWASNYEASIKLRLGEEVRRARNILSQQALQEIVGCKDAHEVEIETRRVCARQMLELSVENAQVIRDVMYSTSAEDLTNVIFTLAIKSCGLKRNEDKYSDFYSRFVERL